LLFGGLVFLSISQKYEQLNWLVGVFAIEKLDIVGEHPAPFPIKIIILPILQTSKEFELVLDPFMGSGTTGRVCDVLNRCFIGYDLKIVS